MLPSSGNPVLHGNDIVYIGTMDMLKLSYGDCHGTGCACPQFFCCFFLSQTNVPFVNETGMATVFSVDVENIFVVTTVVP